jgi:Cu+-exporting ATPase
MGLATPTAVMVGLGRSAKMGILFKGAESVEQLSKIRKVVFDKTGTLTTGLLRIADIRFFTADRHHTLSALHALESHSSHPIAKAIVAELALGKWAEKAETNSRPLSLHTIEEIKGSGMNGTDADGRLWQAGSFKLLQAADGPRAGDVNILCDGLLMAAITLEDDIRPDARQLVDFLHAQGIETVLLSGDRQQKCDHVAQQAGISSVFAARSPADKLNLIGQWADAMPTAMVGDGINDAPALTRATVGISLSGATQVAVNAASVVIMDSGGLLRIRDAFRLGHHTVLTIKQNLFWAFAYNLVAIPLAAFGFLNPMVAALSMAFSDVVVIGNAIRFKFKSII